MIQSGELFLLNGRTGGELQQCPAFLNQNIRVLTANFDRVYVVCEPPVCPQTEGKRPCSVWCFQGDVREPTLCQEFDIIPETIKQIAVGEKHTLVLTTSGVVYSRGTSTYGQTGHGGAKDAHEFAPLPALKNRNVRFVAAGPYYSIAITHGGDVYSWGQAFNGETGIFSSVEAVPRFAPQISKFRVAEISCGHAHVLARTETQQCITWGENTCGQLGLGGKSKATYIPQLLDAIPSQIVCVSAGWAHSVAVGSEGRAYSWGLNSHGQLGLGDTTKRFAPHLLHDLVGKHVVESAYAAKALTTFRTSASRALLCGQVPCAKDCKLKAEFHPRRPGERDPEGCLLSPMPLTMGGPDPEIDPKTGKVGLTRPGIHGFNAADFSKSQLSQVVAFDRGCIGFAQSTVYKVVPNHAPVQGGTQVRAFVTGLPFEHPAPAKSRQNTLYHYDVPCATTMVQDTMPVRVRLKSGQPLCDIVVAGKIVDVDTVEFTTPNATLFPLGSAVETGGASPVQIRVSIDDGFTWTPDRHSPIDKAELDKTMQPSPPKDPTPFRTKVQAHGMDLPRASPVPGENKLNTLLLDRTDGAFNQAHLATALDVTNQGRHPTHLIQEDLARERKAQDAFSKGQVVLWYSKWPKDGPYAMEPSCAPVKGGTELLIKVPLPPRMPTDALIVKFMCKPLHSVDDPALEARAQMRDDASQIINPCKDALAKLPLVPPLEVPVVAWLDPQGMGIRCMSPPLIEESVAFYDYFVEVSLDGRTFLPNPLPFNVCDLNITGLEPAIGPLTDETKVRIVASGLVESPVHKVRLDFPDWLQWESIVVDANLDHTNGEISFVMPSLADEVRKREEAEAQALGITLTAHPSAEDAPAEGEAAAAPADESGTPEDEAKQITPNGGLHELEVCVELSLNGQNFTEDKITFTYYGRLQAEEMKVVALPEGMVAEAAPVDPKAKKPAKGAAEEVAETIVKPGSKLGCPVTPLLESNLAAIRVLLFTKVEGEELIAYEAEPEKDLPAKVETITPPAPPPPPVDPKSKEPPPAVEDPEPVDMLVALAPEIRTEDLPEGAALYMQTFLVSLNGQSFTACPELTQTLRLEPLPPEAVAEGS